MLGDALRDLLDPRLRGGIGHMGAGSIARKAVKAKKRVITKFRGRRLGF